MGAGATVGILRRSGLLFRDDSNSSLAYPSGNRVIYSGEGCEAKRGLEMSTPGKKDGMSAEILDGPLSSWVPRTQLADWARGFADTWPDNIETNDGDPAVGTRRSAEITHAQGRRRSWEPGRRVRAMPLLGHTERMQGPARGPEEQRFRWVSRSSNDVANLWHGGAVAQKG